MNFIRNIIEYKKCMQLIGVVDFDLNIAIKYMHIDLLTTYDKQDAIFHGTLAAGLQFVKKKHAKIILWFEYDAAFLYAKNIPENVSKKNRTNWEEYQQKELFNSNEVMHSFAYDNFNVWLTLGHIKGILQEYRSSILQIKWMGYSLFLKLAQLIQDDNECKIFVIKVGNKFMCLGSSDNHLVVCRVLKSMNNFAYELEETALSLSKYTNGVETCQVYLCDTENEQIDFTGNLPAWLQMQKYMINMDKFAQIIITKDTICLNFFKRITLTWCYLSAIYILCLISVNVFLYKHNQKTSIKYAIQQAQEENNKLYQRLQKEPSNHEIQNVQKLQQQHKMQIEKMQQLNRLIKKYHIVIESLMWKDTEIYIAFGVKKPVNYVDFIQIGQYIKQQLQKMFSQHNIMLKTDGKISQKPNMQIYQYYLVEKDKK